MVDEDWHVDEKKVATVIRFFPDVLSEKKDGVYPIMRAASLESNSYNTYNLKSVSRIPLLAELGSELGQFDEELRGGLLSTWSENVTATNVLQIITCYRRKENETTDADKCFSAVWKRLRENNHFRKEDIREYNLVGNLFTQDIGIFSETRSSYFVDWDPMALKMSCTSENGDFLPIHWSMAQNNIQVFRLVLEAGMRYFHGKLGYVFC